MTGSASAQQSLPDETTELSIPQRNIVQQHYRASTSVEIGPEQTRGVWLRVGVGVYASNIDVKLRAVTGRVRFRGNLEPILKRVNLRK
jgi:hypothetical protein